MEGHRCSSITTETAGALQAALDARAPGEYRTYVAMKHWHPFIGDVIPRIAADGVRRIIAVVLAPHYSRMSVGGYRQYVEDAIAKLDVPVELAFVESWHLATRVPRAHCEPCPGRVAGLPR